MARRLLDKRKEVEAAEARGDVAEPKAKATRAKATGAKKTTATKTRRTKEKVQARKRLVWVVYNGSMKEEGRFSYDQYAAAEEKIEQLRQKSKKMYFIQPVKEVIGEGPGMMAAAAAAAAANAAAAAAAAAAVEEAEAEEDEDEIADEVPDEVAADAEEDEDEDEDDDSDE
ncbi:hypothetical protein [Planctellipticum variicoloris]|uniref:hypothetical protein n=1 Tax=Planctellipticum variicoloris TaxID=3064265 RepID=UPI002CBF68C9|nr:hypothetical protein SH412_000414 [Planctomycetaceae bacterium SH412]HTN01070.1 hypothetical protein [Planctomycetaceae bacterium]